MGTTGAVKRPSSMPSLHRHLLSFVSRAGAAVLLSCVAPAQAAKVSVEIDGLDGDMRDSARANVQLRQYEERDVTAAEVRRLFEQADEQIRQALEPFGYYAPRIEGQLQQPEPQRFVARFEVSPGEPVIVRDVRIEVTPPDAARLDVVRQALEHFEVKRGDRLDHAQYEKSKEQISTALANEGYLKARLARHRVEVLSSDNSATIDLAWEAGERYRLGPVRYTDSQFPEHFMQRYTPWREGDYYSTEKLLGLQQTLVDADYFSSVAVTPDVERALDSVAPVDVLLIPAKRNVYTASLYVSTDSGPGGRLGVERRWLNKRGHRLQAETEYSTRLEEISTRYIIPKPGLRNRNITFGVAYRDEETDTSRSRMARFAATEVTERWRGFTRTYGLQYLNGDFEIADREQSTNLLYAEGLLTRKEADDLYFPVSGYTLLYGLRLAAEEVLSETSLVQIRAEGKRLYQVGKDGRFIARTALGAMAVDRFEVLPPELRFFAGGDRSIRGFDYQQIGETDEFGGVIGGEYLATAGVEYEHYFWGNWGVAAFVDGGDAFKSDFDINVGAGMGLRWKSPIGLLRVDIARPVVSDFEKSWRVHLVIGPDL